MSVYSKGGYKPIQSYGTQQEMDELCNDWQNLHDLQLYVVMDDIYRGYKGDYVNLRKNIYKTLVPSIKKCGKTSCFGKQEAPWENAKKFQALLAKEYKDVKLSTLALKMKNKYGCNEYMKLMKTIFESRRDVAAKFWKYTGEMTYLVKLNVNGGNPVRQPRSCSSGSMSVAANAYEEIENRLDYDDNGMDT